MVKVYLRKVGVNIYGLFNPKNQPMCEFRHFDRKDEAIDWARAWMSSWLGVDLIIEDD